MSIYGSLLQGCANMGDGERAESWLQRMREDGVLPDARAYSAVISAWAAKGDIPRMDDILERMKIDRQRPTAYVFTALFEGCAASTDVDKRAKSKEYYELMQRLRIRPTKITMAAYERSQEA
uniref:PROP1-like PPR domain-containing protein n=2 Tax=Lotharella globosa TaxID=91324 RepID=A0A7S3ZHA9_9EUKA